MVVRIRITRGPRVNEFASGLAMILTLLSVSCFALSAWKFLSDLGWAGGFFIGQGVFSHWQIWIALAVAVQLVSFRLSRHAPLIS
jgi:hypothetical protein